jgi:hypothetical protein
LSQSAPTCPITYRYNLGLYDLESRPSRLCVRKPKISNQLQLQLRSLRSYSDHIWPIWVTWIKLQVDEIDLERSLSDLGSILDHLQQYLLDCHGAENPLTATKKPNVTVYCDIENLRKVNDMMSGTMELGRHVDVPGDHG